MLRCQRLNFNSQTVLRSTGLLETAEQTATVEANETALEHGSGLGLWLVYWLAEKSEADLEFDDSKRGGSAVSIIFRTPTADNPRLEAAAERDRQRGCGRDRRRDQMKQTTSLFDTPGSSCAVPANRATRRHRAQTRV